MSCSLLGSSIVGYLYIQTSYNRKKYERQIEDMSEHDNTRDDTEYFGINWGSAADNLIKEELDTGDIMLIKYECSGQLTLSSVLQCYC